MIQCGVNLRVVFGDGRWVFDLGVILGGLRGWCNLGFGGRIESLIVFWGLIVEQDGAGGMRGEDRARRGCLVVPAPASEVVCSADEVCRANCTGCR